MRFSLVINHGVDTLSPILTPYYSRCEVIEGQECLVSALQSLGGTFQSAVPVDLFEDETIQLTREIKDFLTAEAKTDFTQQFNIPSTPTNDAIFQNYFDENSVLTGWNAFLKLDAQIYIHSIPIFDGCVELTGVEFKNGLPRQYNLIFYGQGKKAIADWGEKTLPMIDWSDYTHTVNYTNVINSWFGNLLSGAVLYPVADWHLGMTYCKVPIVSNNWYQGGLGINDLRPALRFREFITACFADIGYTLSGSLLSKEYFDNLYTIPMAGAGPVQNINNVDAKIDVSLSTSISAIPSVFYNQIIFDTEASDPLNLYNTTTGVYTATLNGQYKFKISGNSTSATGKVTYSISFNGQRRNETVTGAVGAFEVFFIIDLNINTPVKVEYQVDRGNTLSALRWEVVEVPFGLNGSTLNFNVVMPDIKVTNFITNFLRTFNAVLIPTSDTNFELHNIDDYYELGATKEWTEYIDMTDIRHEKVPIPRRIDLKHTEAEDLANVEFTNLYNRKYGSMVASPKVDFSADEFNVESPFTLFLPSVIREKNTSNQLVGDTELQIQTVLDGDFKAVKADLILAYFVERKTIVSDTFELEGVTQYSYPLMSSYQDFPTTSSTNSLTFGIEATLSGDAPTSGLYVNFFQRYLSRVFSSKSRIVHFDAILPVGEWLKLEMNDTIAVSGNYYKIQSIEYDILNEKAHLILMSYPDVELQSYTTTGNSTGWQDAQERPDGVSTLNGDAVGRGVTNSKDNVDGGTVVTILGQTSFGSSTMSYLKGAVDELLKNRSIMIATLDTPTSITTPLENAYETLPLDTTYTLGNSYPYTFASNTITINVAGTYKVTAEVGIYNQSGKDMAVTILLNDLVTSAFANMGKNDQATSISEVFELGEGNEIKVGFACLENHVTPIDVNSLKLRVEKL